MDTRTLLRGVLSVLSLCTATVSIYFQIRFQIIIFSGKLRERRGELTELDSKILGRETVRFLSPNNTLILAHQGSAVTLSCRLNKTPYFGMVILPHLILHLMLMLKLTVIYNNILLTSTIKTRAKRDFM